MLRIRSLNKQVNEQKEAIEQLRESISKKKETYKNTLNFKFGQDMPTKDDLAIIESNSREI